eukprot:scaffold22432_cov168-Amphora_coffeaeformis.AAC.3
MQLAAASTAMVQRWYSMQARIRSKTHIWDSTAEYRKVLDFKRLACSMSDSSINQTGIFIARAFEPQRPNGMVQVLYGTRHTGIVVEDLIGRQSLFLSPQASLSQQYLEEALRYNKDD